MARTVISVAIALLISPLIATADTINGCVKQKNGKLRIVGDPGQCTDKEAAISWESEGPQGPAGAQGPPGDPAPAPPRFELVGFTSTTTLGGVGIFVWTQTCQAEFALSRVCTSVEVMETVSIPARPTLQAWLRPIFEQKDSVGQAVDRVRQVASGRRASSPHLQAPQHRAADSRR